MNVKHTLSVNKLLRSKPRSLPFGASLTFAFIPTTELRGILTKNKITPDPLKDQFFLIDEKTIKQMVNLADLTKNDTVLEIGTGTGNLTRELAKKAGQVISFEIDERFKLLLDDLPANVDLHFADAWDCVQLHGKFRQRRKYNKVVTNLPYSFAEKFLHNLTFLIYDKVILLIPQSLADKIETNPVFGSFFQVEEKLKVSKNKFYPVLKTKSVVIDLKKLSDLVITKNPALFLRQFIYQKEENKVKNSLREGLIKYVYLASGKRLTKNRAREIIDQNGIDKELLDKPPDNPQIYQQIREKLNNVPVNPLANGS